MCSWPNLAKPEKHQSPKAEAREYWKEWQTTWGNMEAPGSTSPDAGYVYFLICGQYVKIGKSKHPIKRFPQIVVKMPLPTNLFALWWTPKMTALEMLMHTFYAEYRVNGEWFELPVEELLSIKACEGIFLPVFLPTAINKMHQENYGMLSSARKELYAYFKSFGTSRTGDITPEEMAKGISAMAKGAK